MNIISEETLRCQQTTCSVFNRRGEKRVRTRLGGMPLASNPLGPGGPSRALPAPAPPCGGYPVLEGERPAPYIAAEAAGPCPCPAPRSAAATSRRKDSRAFCASLVMDSTIAPIRAQKVRCAVATLDAPPCTGEPWKSRGCDPTPAPVPAPSGRAHSLTLPCRPVGASCCCCCPAACCKRAG